MSGLKDSNLLLDGFKGDNTINEINKYEGNKYKKLLLLSFNFSIISFLEISNVQQAKMFNRMLCKAQ